MSDSGMGESTIERIDLICDRFEKSWLAGKRPRLEDYLAQARSDDKARLLAELLRLELYYRRRTGEIPDLADYLGRFPEHEELLTEHLAESVVVESTVRPAPMPPLSSAALPAASDARTQVPPPTAVPGYEILEVLGRGGMGIVCKARHLTLKRVVALKMILAGSQAGEMELTRFRAEAEVVARLRHPNIVQIYEVGEFADASGAIYPFMALELVEGGNLARQLAGAPQPPQQAAELVELLARAVQVAHEAGIVHRDLKPANVLLTPDNVPKVADFGLAKRLDAAVQTLSGLVVGTPSYMAPEQAEGKNKEVGPRADVYALGAILYELLTGRAPFRGASVAETLAQVVYGEAVPPRRLNRAAPRDLETICLKCLRKEAGKRYQSASALAEDLRRFLDGRPIKARPVSAWERALKWAGRRPAQAALIGAVVLAVLGGTAGALFYGLYKDQQAAALEQRLQRGHRVDELWGLGREAENAGRYAEAKQHYDQALALLDADAGLISGELRLRIAEGRDRVVDKQAEEDSLQKKSVARADFQRRNERFGLHRDEVFSHAVSFRDEDAASDSALVRREAPAALAQLRLSVGGPPEVFAAGLQRWRPLVDTPEQMNRVAAECYELLLVWAEKEEASNPRQALLLLNGAAALGNAYTLTTPRTFHLQYGRVLELLGDKDNARLARDRAAAVKLSSALDHFQAGLDHYRKDQLEQAAASCEEALRLEPNHFWAQYLKVLCNVRAQPPRWREAKVGLEACLGRRPGSVSLLMLLGTAQGELKEFAAAEGNFQRALDKATTKPLRATVLTNRSTMRLRAGRWDDARRDLLEARDLQPAASYICVNLAQAYQQRGELEEAVKVLDRALQLRPDAALFNMRARLQAKRGKPALARADFEQVVAWEPRGARSIRLAAAHVELAHRDHLAREYGAALAHCEAALDAQPNYAPAYLQQARTLLEQGNSTEAGKALDRYLAGGTREAVFYQVRGLIHTKRGEHAQAVEAYSRSLFLKSDVKTLSYRGWAYLALESPRLALPDFDAALQGESKNRDALCGRGLARVQLGHAAEALLDAEAALRQAPNPDRRLVQSCARIYARAVGVFEATGERTAEGGRAYRCQERALQLVRETLQLVPQVERAAFWHSQVSGDPAFRSLHNTQGWRDLIRAFPR
jgi:tetratricopeptide (TPR) repeat protein